MDVQNPKGKLSTVSELWTWVGEVFVLILIDTGVLLSWDRLCHGQGTQGSIVPWSRHSGGRGRRMKVEGWAGEMAACSRA